MISLLLGQASVADDIAAHPALTLIIISALGSALIAVMKVLLGFMEKRVNEKFDGVNEKFDAIEKRDVEWGKATDEKFDGIHSREDKQEERLDHIETDLRNYDKHVAVGERESNEIHTAIKRVEASLSAHTIKEENVTWAKIDKIADSLQEMKLSNEIAHAGLVAGQTILTNRVEAVERKMPNGELEKLAAAYHVLAERDQRGGPKPKPKPRKARK